MALGQRADGRRHLPLGFLCLHEGLGALACTDDRVSVFRQGLLSVLPSQNIDAEVMSDLVEPRREPRAIRIIPGSLPPGLHQGFLQDFLGSLTLHQQPQSKPLYGWPMRRCDGGEGIAIASRNPPH